MTIISIISLVVSCLCLFVLGYVVFKLHKTPTVQQSVDTENITKSIEGIIATQKELSLSLNQMVLSTIKNNNDTLVSTISQNHTMQFQQQTDVLNRLNTMLQTSEQSMKNAINVIETGLVRLQQDNEKKLEQMRQTVDEKLNSSLENRLSQSFSIINERLQAVYEGIGVMKQLASGVGDLKKVLTNVKTRGTFGEVQLGALIEQMLAPNQYAEQVQIGESLDRVDYAIFMPGKNNDNVILPVDSKFPIEDYNRLVEATEIGDIEQISACRKALEKRVKDEAKKIHDKYINVPQTTEFGVLYLATEGLYSEVLKNDGLIESLQRDFRIIICGPTTFSALLNSLQMGFKTLAIEKQSADIWNALSIFKKEFVTFVELLSKTQKKIDEAGNTIESATKKSQTIQRKLDKFVGIEFDEDDNTRQLIGDEE